MMTEIEICDLEEYVKWGAIFDNKFDFSNEGYLSEKEFRRLLNAYGLYEDLPTETINKMIDLSDQNADGYISRVEFIRVMTANVLTVSTIRKIEAKTKKDKVVKLSAVAILPTSKQTDYYELYTCLPPPLFMPIITLIEVIVFIYYCVDMGVVSMTEPVPITSVFIYNPNVREEVWRFLTYMLVHAGIEHILFNTLFQLILGIPLEMVHGFWRVGLVYLAGVIGGSLASSIFDPNVYLCGASGGVYAMIAAHCANAIINYSEMQYAAIRITVMVSVSCVDLGISIWKRFFLDGSTSFVAHLAGAFAGLAMGIVCLKNLEEKTYEKVLWWICLVSYIGVVLIAIFWNIFAV